ncbi:MAG: 1-acyl-sn-glycerol-3-phosphate acyltransferase [Candidatus Palauibacterales bacterium]|nr:1-acyl-sn-glycerol-3-phosphate acyltransferase [Candidatus Palauibacterales bacterium]
MRPLLVYLMLRGVKAASRLLFHHDMRWIGEVPRDPWADLRLVVILNHTSLYEPLFVGGVPNRFLWSVASRAVVPVAQKTATRPLVGRFFSRVAAEVEPVTRERDHTWERFVARAREPGRLAVILPEGRMKRRDGLDRHGEPMTIRGGIADLIREIPDGRMLLAYSGGLHHVQAPGDRWPRLFQVIRMRLESLGIADYRSRLMSEAGEEGFKRAVIRDLTHRRDTRCP